MLSTFHKRWNHSQTLVEKIVQKYAVGSARVSQGDFVSIQPFRIMTHDNTGPVISKYRILTQI
jgi:homoaconitate hydratase